MGRITKWDEVEAEIAKAVAAGILVDKRSRMPKAKTSHWKTRKPEDILGACVHQGAGKNTTDPRRTAAYHTSKDNHITPGTPLPSLCYHIAIVEDGTVWLCSDLSWRTYAQGASMALHPGDENLHLISILVMGGFHGAGWSPSWSTEGPTHQQVESLQKIVAWLQVTFGFGNDAIFGHYHFGKAACPGWKLQTWIEEHRVPCIVDDTKDFQEALLRWKPGCLASGADGVYGPQTRKALVEFQRGQGMQVTGREGPFTALVLAKKYPDPAWVEPDIKCDDHFVEILPGEVARVTAIEAGSADELIEKVTGSPGIPKTTITPSDKGNVDIMTSANLGFPAAVNSDPEVITSGAMAVGGGAVEDEDGNLVASVTLEVEPTKRPPRGEPNGGPTRRKTKKKRAKKSE